jgi:glycosyltransferase involved in cell wall biosynthesis
LTRVAFVIPWYGRDLLGGAEQHVFQVTTRLARRGHGVEVLTTCCRSFHDDWQQNAFASGTSDESGVVVRRFPVRRRDVAAFDRANAELIALNDRPKPAGANPVSDATERAFVHENIHAPELLDFVEREANRYAAVVFAPYLYGPSLLGVGRARNAVLQPLLHDESYAYLSAVDRIFRQARRVLFISEGEAQLAATLYGPSMWRKGVVTGAGVESSPRAAGEAWSSELEPDRFLLYLGRRAATKNVDLLVRAYRVYRSARGGRLRLVLAGPGDLPLAGEGILDLGVLDDTRKSWLLSNCRALVQPSRNESYSRTMMEAWLRGKPVIVNGHCLATALAVEASGGGWQATGEADWASAFAQVESCGEEELRERGGRGRRHAEQHADWEKAIDRYEKALDLLPRPRRLRPATPPGPGAIHQLTPNLSYGDAISNDALFIREILHELGYRSEIFVRYFDPTMSALAKPFEPGSSLAPEDGLLYHYSIGSELTAYAVAHPGPKALVYHNITPAHFFQPWEPEFAKLLVSGRADLRRLALEFVVSAGDSAFNASELREAGFASPRVLPIFVDPMRWSERADPRWMRDLQDGRTNILFVGRVAPNKCHHHLLEAFAEYLRFDPAGRLVVAGYWPEGNAYAAFLRDRATRLGIASRVLWTSSCSDAQLQACYRTAHLYWSMSEHEGFGVPLVEAMWFDVPVLAYRSTGVPETLGKAGILFTEKRWPELAALARLLVEDPVLRRKALAAQRERRAAFLPEAVLPSFVEFVRELTSGKREARAAS